LPEDGSLESKHVAKYVLMILHVLCLNKLFYLTFFSVLYVCDEGGEWRKMKLKSDN